MYLKKGNIKTYLFCSFLILFLAGCDSRDSIRRKALECDNHYVGGPITNIMEWYSHSYYRLPESFDEVIAFFDREWSVDSTVLIYEKPDIECFRRQKPLYAYYRDSVFIYDPKVNISYSIEGHPLYWLEHPERFPEDLPDYWGNFRPAAYLKDGLISRSFDYEKYKIWTRKRIDAICRYERKTDELTVLAGVDKPYKISPGDTALIQRLAAVKDTVRMFMKENPDIYSYVFPMQLSEKGNPWRFRFFEDWDHRNAGESAESE